MKSYQSLLAKLYLKNFVILFLALELFFTGIDLMQNFKHLSPSANLQILYASHVFLNFINYTLPLSLLFAMLTTIFQLIRSNELVSLYSLGISKNRVIAPIFSLSLLITLIYIGFNASTFVKAQEYAYSIKQHGKISDTSKHLFLKSGEDYIFFESLNPLKKEASNITIFKTKDTDITHIIKAQKALFKEDHWELQNIQKITKPQINMPQAKLHYNKIAKMDALEGFKPQIIDNFFNGKSKLTIQDSFAAITLLKEQGLKTDKIRANLYLLILFPLFAPIAILALFYPLPAQRRSHNIALLSTLYIFIILVLWGILFTLSQIATNGAILPELGIILPLVLLFFATIYLIYKNR